MTIYSLDELLFLFGTSLLFHVHVCITISNCSRLTPTPGYPPDEEMPFLSSLDPTLKHPHTFHIFQGRLLECVTIPFSRIDHILGHKASLGKVPNRKRSTSRLYIVTLLI